MRRGLCVLALIAAMGGQVAVAQADTPTGSHLAFIRMTLSFPGLPRPNVDNFIQESLLTSGPLGEVPQTILGSSIHSPVVPITGPSWSPDGSTIAVGGAAGLVGSSRRADIYLLGADGSGLRQLTRLGDASSPVFSSDGRSIFFARGRGLTVSLPTIKGHHTTFVLAFATHTAVWQIGIDGTGLQRLTPKRKAISDLPLSVSPVTGDLAFSRAVCQRRKCRDSIHLLSPATGADSQLFANADQAAFSPDGKELALASNRAHNWPKHPFRHNAVGPASELYVLDLATGVLRRLTYTRGVAEGAPSWDPSAQRIAYLRAGLGGTRLMEINADGSCQTGLFEKPLSLFSPQFLGVAWEPGAGHEAGRIAC